MEFEKWWQAFCDEPRENGDWKPLATNRRVKAIALEAWNQAVIECAEQMKMDGEFTASRMYRLSGIPEGVVLAV